MCDLRRWSTLSLLKQEFVETLQSTVVFGATGNEVLMLTRDDHMYAMGLNCHSSLGTHSLGSPTQSCLEPKRIDFMSGKKIKKIAFGGGPHVLALSEDGKVYSWGKNTYGQLGLGHSLQGTSPMLVQGALAGERVVHIACGGEHSVAVTERGEVFAWGQNSTGQLGIDNTVDQDTPRQVPLYNRIVVSVACCNNSTIVLTQSGDVYAWGYNGNGEVGAGTLCNQHVPLHLEGLSKVGPITQISCGFAHAMALSDQGELFVWGSNSCGQLGGNLARKNQLEPVAVAKELDRITDVAAIHLCNLTAVTNKSGKVFVWGNLRGQSMANPMEVRMERIEDAFVCLASPPVSCRMLTFGVEQQTGILDAVREAFDDKETSDLRIHVDGRVLYAHKALLKIRCQYFRTRLGEKWSESGTSDIFISDFSYNTFRSFLHYVYTDEVSVEGVDATIGLLELANCYCEELLKKECCLLLEQLLSVDNAAQVYSLSVKYSIKPLEDTVFSFCLNHMTAVTQSDAFRQLDDAAIKRLISRASKEGIFKR